jgi:intracellular multiplication protein IcmE
LGSKLVGAAVQAAGFDVAKLRAAGFGVTALRAAGFDVAKVRKAGVGFAELRAAGFTAQELVDGGFGSEIQCRNCGTKGDKFKARPSCGHILDPLIKEIF